MPTGAKSEPGPLTQEVVAILRGHQARKRIATATLAEAAGLSESQVRKILAGRKHVDVDTLDALAEAVDEDLVDIVREADRASEGRFLPKRSTD